LWRLFRVAPPVGLLRPPLPSCVLPMAFALPPSVAARAAVAVPLVGEVRPLVSAAAFARPSAGPTAGAPSVAAFACGLLAPAAVASRAAARRQRRNGLRRPVSVAAVQGDEIKFASSSSGDKEPELPPLSLENRARVLAESLPGLARLNGKVVVIKYGGAAMVESPERTIRDVALLRALGLKPVLVHGGGPEINSWLAKVGIEPKFVRGLRVTDAATMEVVAMVLMGKVNKGIVATMGAAGIRAVGLGGMDGGLLKARQVDDKELGFVGEVTSANVEILKAALEDGLVPVVATVATDEQGNFLNVNADTAAAAIAGALNASEFVLMTDVPGIMRDVKDPSSLIQELDIAAAKKLIEEGIVAGGMIPKVTCMISALDAGVTATHIIDGRRPHALLEELFGSSGSKQGTTIAK